jgi:ferredoxin
MGRSRKGVELFASTSKYKNAMCKLAGLPLLRSLLRRILVARGTTFTFIPVYEGVELPGGTAMPISVVEHFIDRAGHHVIIDFCPCRKSFDCKDYPVERGCTFIGEGARQINPEVGRHVSKEEALAYLREGIEMGLVPVFGKIDFDAVMLGVKDRDRLMTICQCCPCCCLTTALHYASPSVQSGVITRMDGLEVKVTGDCVGCGECVEACIFKHINVVGGRAVVSADCVGCGRCAAGCKQQAISITINDSDYLQASIDRIGARVDVT